MTQVPDIVIIGSGIGGATVAAGLAGSGARIAILERGERLPDTPEDGFIPDPDLSGRALSVDAVLCLAGRMDALLVLLQSDGQDPGCGFRAAHEHILHVLWTLQGQVSQLRALAENAAAGPRQDSAT